jgi:Holliday junction resolvase-like predicted endonuclease
MSTERETLIAILKLTGSGPTDCSLVGKSARIPAETVEDILKKLAENALVRWRGKVVEASPNQRVEIAIEALRMGADFESVCSLLEWREFESVTTASFETYNYQVTKNFRFKERSGKRWEIDLLACKHPLVISVDCKHWRHNWTRAPVMRVTEEHVERTRAFTDVLPNFFIDLGLDKWVSATVVPVVLSLLPAPFKFHHGTPVVPVLQLQSFLSELPGHTDSLTYFSQKLTRLDKEITEY